MKIRKRFLVIVLICSLLIGAFVGCGGLDEEEKRSQIESIFDQIETESDSESESEGEEMEHVYVVIPKSCSSQLAERALDFAEMLEEKTGLLVDLKYDNEHSSFPSSTCEILVGHTNRLGSENAMQLLKSRDYICRWDTGALVICGGSEETTLKALEDFISDILPKSTRYSIMDKYAGFRFVFNDSDTESKNDETQPERSTFNGYVIDEFLITYDSANEHGEREMAEILSSLIASRSGYILDVVPSNEIDSHTGKTISIAYDKNTGPCIESDERNIVIKGSNEYNISLAVAEFVERMDSATHNGVITFACDRRISVAGEAFDCSVTTYFIKKADDLYSFAEFLDSVSSGNDVYILVDVDEDVERRLSVNMPKDYEIHKIESFSRDLMLLYNSKTVSKLTSRVDDGAGAVKIEIKLISGETVKCSCYLDSETEPDEIDRRELCFIVGGTVGSDIPFGLIMTEGTAIFESSNVSYRIAAGDTLYTYKDGVKVSDTEIKLELSVRLKTDVSYRLLALTDSLK